MGKDFLSNINSIKMPGEYPISKYRKVIKKADPAKDSEIRVRVNSPPFAYAAYAGKLLLQKQMDFVYLNATGAAVSNSIKVIEYLKRHIKGLHISYNILSKEFVDEYEPKVEGLEKVTTKRTVSTLEAVLTTTKGEELAKEVGYMAPSANEDDIDQKGFEDSMAKYNERKATKQDGGDRRGGDRRGRTQSGKYNDNEERKEGGNGGERRTNNYDNREGGDRRRYNNDNRDGGDRRRNDNRDGGDRRNDNRDVKRYDNRDNRDNRNRDNYTKTDNYQKDDRRTDDRRDGGDNRRGGDRRDGGDRNYDNRRREDGDNRGGRGRGGDRGGRGRGGDRGDRRGGDRREDNRNENYQKDYKNDRD